MDIWLNVLIDESCNTLGYSFGFRSWIVAFCAELWMYWKMLSRYAESRDDFLSLGLVSFKRLRRNQENWSCLWVKLNRLNKVLILS
jgi:hypothetical protein